MKTQGIKNLYLPIKIAKHAKIILFSLAFIPLWSLIIKGELHTDFMLYTFIVMVVDIELILIMGDKIFVQHEAKTRKEVTNTTIKQIGLFLLACNIIVIIVFVIFLFSIYLINDYDLAYMLKHSFKNELLGVVKVSNIGFSLAIPIMLYNIWQDAMKREFKLREEKLIFQNQTLKNQVNPHFLFNSLNTLSALVTTQTEIAETFVNRLSAIYRYILENAPKDKVLLVEELNFIKDYYYLQKIRNEDKVELLIDFSSPKKYEIIPVSLQLLIENAIKHNMATREKPLKIIIEQEDAYIVVKNNLQKMASLIDSPGTGLQNLKERIHLSMDKDLLVEITNQEFIVKVPLIPCK